MAGDKELMFKYARLAEENRRLKAENAMLRRRPAVVVREVAASSWPDPDVEQLRREEQYRRSCAGIFS